MDKSSEEFSSGAHRLPGTAPFLSLLSRDLSHDDWLDARSQLVTSSDASHLLGTADRRWRLDLNALVKRKTSRDDLRACLPRSGQINEPGIIRLACEYMGVSMAANDALWRDEERGLGCTPDGVLTGINPLSPSLDDLDRHLYFFSGGERVEGHANISAVLSPRVGETLVEVKSQKSKKRSKWRSPGYPPPHYESQCRHHMMVAKAPCCLLIARVDESEIYAHLIERDTDYEELFMEPTYEDFLEFLRKEGKKDHG